MRLLFQRVLSASVTVDGKLVSKINRGLLIFLGIHPGDTPELAEKLADKSLNVRLWDEIIKQESQQQQAQQDALTTSTEQSQEEQKQENKKKKEKQPKSWNTCLVDNNYDVMVVSQFTLYAIWKGNKPDFHNAMNADEANKIYEIFLNRLKKKYQPEKVQGGAFQQYMHVELVNDGPVTIQYEEDAKQQIDDQKIQKIKENKKQQHQKTKQQQGEYRQQHQIDQIEQKQLKEQSQQSQNNTQQNQQQSQNQ